MRYVLIVLGAVTLLTGPYILFAPQTFYENTPGLSMMGPFSLHFIRDVGLAFFASGACVLTGAIRRERSLAVAGALWPFLHGLFHIQIWIHRGAPFDHIATFDFFAVIIPASAMMGLALKFETNRQGAA